MNIVFVSSGNRLGSVSPIIRAQGESLAAAGHSVSYYLIKGKGVFGYLSNIIPLRKYLSSTKYDIVHAHFSYCGYVTLLAGGSPSVLSLMGSDLNAKKYSKYILRYFCKFFFNVSIVKSVRMQQSLGLRQSFVIPNGVNIDVFKPIDKFFALKKLGWSNAIKHILFAANPDRPEKNFELAEKSLNKINNSKDFELHFLSNVPHELIPYYMSASDVVLLTSKWEGSPNVIKEAMACNRPIVCTDVGDVSFLFEGVHGCFIAKFNEDDLKVQIESALIYSSKKWISNGRQKIIQIGYDSQSTVKKLINSYESINHPSK